MLDRPVDVTTLNLGPIQTPLSASQRSAVEHAARPAGTLWRAESLYAEDSARICVQVLRETRALLLS